MNEDPPSKDPARNAANSTDNTIPTPQTENATAQRAHQSDIANAAAEGRKRSESRSLKLLQRLTFNEWLTLLIGIGSLVVSALTYKNAADTSDLQAAVKNLTNLAVQTKRQADAAQGQLDQTIAGNRPIIWLNEFGPKDARPGSHWSAPFQRMNVGKSVGIHVLADFDVKIGAKETPPADFISRFRHPCVNCPPDVMVPNIPQGRGAAINGAFMTEAQIKNLTFPDATQVIWFIGRIDYEDTSGNKHKSGFCYRIMINPVQYVACEPAFDLVYME